MPSLEESMENFYKKFSESSEDREDEIKYSQ